MLVQAYNKQSALCALAAHGRDCQCVASLDVECTCSYISNDRSLHGLQHALYTSFTWLESSVCITPGLAFFVVTSAMIGRRGLQHLHFALKAS
jgi:hypothetical protein